ncbi:MAG TPA: hypothetical protein P5191_05930 [Ruminococcus sp.]|nr:hypothetical protein [Ruminococcus sp.]
MKKIIAALAAFASACTLMTGCGKDDSSSSKGASSNPDSYEDALRDMFEASNDEDLEKVAKYMYPDELYDFMIELGYGEDFIEQTSGDTKKKEITEIIEEEELEEDAIKEFETMLTTMDDVMNVYREHGLSKEKTMDDLDEKEKAEILEKIGELQDGDADHSNYNVTKAYDVTVKYTQDGEDDEDCFYAFYVEDEGWLFQQSMRTYVKKSKKQSANATASSLSKAINSALIDFDMNDIDIYGTYIISSDSSKNKDVPSDIDIDKLDSQIKKYFEDIDETDYFCVVSDGSAGYVAVDYKSNIGTYPANSILEKSGDGEPDLYVDSRIMKTEEENYSLDELYDVIVDYMK